MPVICQNWLMTGEARGVADRVLDVEPLTLILHGGGEWDLEVPCLPARMELEVGRSNI
jgi:hypothetical protein